MIIVSQDKTMIINFDNVLGIGRNEKSNDILAVFKEEAVQTIGCYKTTERAKEVLDDIANTKAIFEFYKCIDADIQDIFDKKMLDENLTFDTYQMPDE